MHAPRWAHWLGAGWVASLVGGACAEGGQQGLDVNVNSGNIDASSDIGGGQGSEVSEPGETGETRETGDEVSDSGGPEIADSGPSEVGDTLPSGPLLEWPGVLTEACIVTRAPAIADPSNWFPSDLAVGPSDRAYLVAVERGLMAGNELFLAPLALDGTVGERLALDDSPGYSADAAMLRLGGTHVSEFLVAWGHMREDGAETLRVAIVSIDGATGKAELTQAGRDVAEVGWLAIQTIRLLPVEGGVDAYLAASAVDGGVPMGASSLRRVPLATGGTLRAGAGGPRTLVDDAAEPSVVATANGTAAVWTASAAVGTEVFFGRFDASGAAVGTPRRLSVAGAEGVGSGLASRGGALIRAGNALWAVWSEWTFNGAWEAPEGHSVLRLAMLDGAGEGPTVGVQAAENDIVNQGGSFFVNGDHIALTWQRGTAIHICAGCYVDYPVHVVLLDPATATPVSEVATLDPVNGHGHASALFAVLEAGIVMASSLDFHALTMPATAAFQCGPKAP